ncbi:MAG TPA: nucleotidyl transferase AbiEii/AbiGii toxin family protein [Candidatus Binataceae bacterium]|nr:nucleotidyl transferase AbiEii/AbiGii toxin family protein [Candidatus Binataceae bacterium]
MLYSGTAVALRLGHRTSLDFDLFSSEPLNVDALYRTIPFLVNSTPLQREADALTVLVQRRASVKVSFFGGIGIGCIDPPELAEDAILQVASPRDLMGTKLKVLLQRVEGNYYRDIAALLRSGITLGEALARRKRFTRDSSRRARHSRR